MKRRDFIAAVSGVAALQALPVTAQQKDKVRRVGIVLSTSPVSSMDGSDPSNPAVRAFVRAMRARGYIEGENLILERRSAEGHFERLAEIATELVRLGVDAIVAGPNDIPKEAARITKTVPIVMAGSFSPVETGLVESLARPGGNITGFTANVGPEVEAKRLQMLTEVIPAASRIVFLGTRSAWEGIEGRSVRAAAPKLGIALAHAEHSPIDYVSAFALIIQDRPHALFVSSDRANFANRQLIVDFAQKQRLPGAYPYRELVEAGGLLSYGANLPDLYARAAGHVDKILKGTQPADIPVEQPTRFELVVNLKTAKALGLTIPPAILIQADEVIE
jgi:putative tryptophan/tyrosine transport system substrate-binding protein